MSDENKKAERERKKTLKRIEGLTPGVDVANTAAKPNTVTIVMGIVVIGAVIGIQLLFAADARSSIPELQAEVEQLQADEEQLESRLQQVIATNADERLASLRAQSVLLDDKLPYTGSLVDIETFEIQLSSMVSEFGLEGSQQQRGSLTEDRNTGMVYRPIQITVSGQRSNVFSWVRALRDINRHVTVNNLSYSIADGDPSSARAQMQLRLWFSDEETVALMEATAEGRLRPDGTIAPRDDADDLPDVQPEPDAGFDEPLDEPLDGGGVDDPFGDDPFGNGGDVQTDDGVNP